MAEVGCRDRPISFAGLYTLDTNNKGEPVLRCVENKRHAEVHGLDKQELVLLREKDQIFKNMRNHYGIPNHTRASELHVGQKDELEEVIADIEADFYKRGNPSSHQSRGLSDWPHFPTKVPTRPLFIQYLGSMPTSKST